MCWAQKTELVSALASAVLYRVQSTEEVCRCVQIREKEANLDVLIMPIDDMYALLAR